MFYCERLLIKAEKSNLAAAGIFFFKQKVQSLRLVIDFLYDSGLYSNGNLAACFIVAVDKETFLCCAGVVARPILNFYGSAFAWVILLLF